MAELNCIIYRYGGHETIKESKNTVIKEVRIVVPCWGRVGGSGVLLYQSESQADGNMLLKG